MTCTSPAFRAGPPRAARWLAGCVCIACAAMGVSTVRAQSAAQAVSAPPNEVGRITIDPRLGREHLEPVARAAAPSTTGAPAAGQPPQPAAGDVLAGVDERSGLDDPGRRWLGEQVQQAQALAGGALRMEVIMGALDGRLRLAPCSRIEPYLPAGSRLWGRARVGLRCTEGPVRWNVFLPVTVKAWGPAWVLRNPVRAGQVLAEDDAQPAEVDWASSPAPVLADRAQWLGQIAARALPAGQPLRDYMVKLPDIIVQGDTVRVLVNSGTFQITASGQAMGNAAKGQSVRVKLDTGRTVSGTAVAEQTVQLRI